MANVKRVLLTNSSDIYGGGEFYVLELATALMRREYNVVVCCRPDNLLASKARGRGLLVEPLAFPPNGRLFEMVRALRRIIERHDIQIVHTNGNYDRTAGAIAARLAGRRHVTNVHSFHSLQHNFTHWIRNQFLTDHYLVDGRCVQTMLVRDDGIPAEKVSVVYLGVNPESMKPDAGARKRVREEWGVGTETILLGNVGRMVPMKGQEYLVRAFAHIAQSFPAAGLVLVGDGELRTNLADIVRESGLVGRVHFPGFRDDLVDVYSAFDIYVQPSVEGGGETFPFAVLQALAQELPVVVTRVGDVAAMVVEGRNGYVVDDRNHEALATAFGWLIENEELRRSMGQESRAFLLRRFTTDIMVDNIEKIYALMAAPHAR